MSEKLDLYQQKAVNLLLDSYERTKSYRGEAQLRQNISVPVTRIFPAYEQDDVPIAELRDFEASMRELERISPIRIQYKDRKIKGEFKALTVAAAQVEPALYDLCGRLPKRQLHEEQIAVYEAYRRSGSEEIDTILDRYIDAQEALLAEDRNAWYDPDTAREVMRIVSAILHNTSDLLFRELSISLYGDTKYIERHGLLRKALRVLKTYGEYDFTADDFDTEAEYEMAILAEYSVYENPTYVVFHGNGMVEFAGGTRLELHRGVPAAIRSDKIQDITRVSVSDPGVLTIENLTSFNRMTSPCFQLYLAGYHNRARQNFLVKIHEQNPALRTWYHFGDLDPDGFCILENLRNKTGIDFQPYEMTQENLQTYAAYGKPLNDNDRRKAAGLIEKNRYVLILQYMLTHNIKLEQEIISWKNVSRGQVQ